MIERILLEDEHQDIIDDLVYGSEDDLAFISIVPQDDLVELLPDSAVDDREVDLVATVMSQ